MGLRRKAGTDSFFGDRTRNGKSQICAIFQTPDFRVPVMSVGPGQRQADPHGMLRFKAEQASRLTLELEWRMDPAVAAGPVMSAFMAL